MTKENYRTSKFEIDDDILPYEISQEPYSLWNAAFELKNSRHAKDENRRVVLHRNKRSANTSSNEDRPIRVVSRYHPETLKVNNKNNANS